MPDGNGRGGSTVELVGQPQSEFNQDQTHVLKEALQAHRRRQAKAQAFDAAAKTAINPEPNMEMASSDGQDFQLVRTRPSVTGMGRPGPDVLVRSMSDPHTHARSHTPTRPPSLNAHTRSSSHIRGDLQTRGYSHTRTPFTSMVSQDYVNLSSLKGQAIGEGSGDARRGRDSNPRLEVVLDDPRAQHFFNIFHPQATAADRESNSAENVTVLEPPKPPSSFSIPRPKKRFLHFEVNDFRTPKVIRRYFYEAMPLGTIKNLTTQMQSEAVCVVKQSADD